MKRTFIDLHFESGAVHPFELLDGRFVIGSDAESNLVIELAIVAAHMWLWPSARALSWSNLLLTGFM